MRVLAGKVHGTRKGCAESGYFIHPVFYDAAVVCDFEPVSEDGDGGIFRKPRPRTSSGDGYPESCIRSYRPVCLFLKFFAILVHPVFLPCIPLREVLERHPVDSVEPSCFGIPRLQAAAAADIVSGSADGPYLVAGRTKICRILQDVFLPGGVLAFAFRPDAALSGVCMWMAFSRLSCPCQLSTLMLVLPPYDITSSTK